MRKQRNASRPLAAGRSAKVEVPKAWEAHHARLLKLREKVLEDAHELSSGASEMTLAFSMHPADAASDSFDRDLALSLLSFEQDALGEIDDALRRIREGSYGVCELTGKPIPLQRLEAIPWARYTAEAQARLEDKGARSRAHLNAAELVPRENNGS